MQRSKAELHPRCKIAARCDAWGMTETIADDEHDEDPTTS
jgi:hypothetical protein